MRSAVTGALILHLATRLVFVGSEGVQKWMDFSGYFPPCRLAEFVLGLAVGRVFVHTRATPVRISNNGAIALLVGSVFLLTGVVKPLGVTGSLLLWPLAFTCAIYAIARTGAGGPMLNGRAALLLGEASYAMYLLHVPAALYVVVVTKKAIESGDFGVIGLLGYIAAVVVLSIAVFRFLECPLRDWLRRLLGGGTSAKTPDTQTPASRSSRART